MFRWYSLIPDYNGRRQIVRFGIVRSKSNPKKWTKLIRSRINLKVQSGYFYRLVPFDIHEDSHRPATNFKNDYHLHSHRLKHLSSLKVQNRFGCKPKDTFIPS